MPIHRKTTSQFVEDARQVHGDRFDYSEVEYVNTHKPVRIKCRQCGVVFMQEPASHLAGHGYPNCGKQQLKRRMSQEVFIEKCRAVHGNRYDYSRTEYRDMRSKVLIVCPRHGEFRQRAQSHILGNGCPECKREKHMERITELQKQLALLRKANKGISAKYNNCGLNVQLSVIVAIFASESSKELESSYHGQRIIVVTYTHNYYTFYCY